MKKEHRNKRSMLALAASVLAAASLAGCGGKAVDSKQEGTEAGGKQEGGMGSTEHDSGNVKLKFWCDEDESELFLKQIDSFIEEHKGEAKIEVTYEPVAASVCKDELLGDVTEGADVFCMPDDQLLTMVSSGVLEEVSDGGAVAARNVEGSVSAASVDGKLYAYPLTADNGYFLYYDKRYFSEGDVQTLDRILEVCARNNKKFVMDFTSGWYLYSFFGNTGLTLSLNEDGLTNSCDWNAKKGKIKGVDIAKALLAVTRHPGFLNGADPAKAVLEGDAVAAVSGVWDIASMKKAFGGDYGACKLPTYTCAGRQVQMASFTGYRLLGVNAYSGHREWAEKLADYLSGEECQEQRFEQAQRGPSNSNAAASDAIRKVPAIMAVMEQAKYGVLQQVGQKYWAPATEFGRTMAKGNPGNMPLQDLMDELANGITE